MSGVHNGVVSYALRTVNYSINVSIYSQCADTKIWTKFESKVTSTLCIPPQDSTYGKDYRRFSISK